MSRLRQGTSLILGRHGVTAVSRQRPPCFVPAAGVAEQVALARGALGAFAAGLGDHVEVDGSPVADGDGLAAAVADPVVLARLVELDRAFAGGVPGFLAREAERLAAVEAMHARRRALPEPRAARPTLPCSTVRRAAVLSATAAPPGAVLLDEDLDGLGVLLAAAGRAVHVLEPHPAHRAWLADEARRAGVELTFGRPPPGSCAVAVIAVGGPGDTAASLALAVEVVVPGGAILAQLRAPFDGRFIGECDAAGLVLREHHREIDLTALPGPYVVDGAGDLLVLERPAAAVARAAVPDPSASDPGASVRAQPYYWLDFDDLAEERLARGALERFADVVRAHHAGGEDMRAVVQEDGRELLAWYDPAGVGFTAELARAERHLMLTLMPYDPQLELLVQWAVFTVLGDDFTRMRPLLTVHHHKEAIVG